MADAKVRFTSDTKSFQAGVNQVNSSMGSLKTTVAGIGAAFAAIGVTKAISSIANFGTQAVISSSKAAASFETLQVQFEVLIGDVTKANRLLKEMQIYGATTPLQLKDLQQATKLLLAFGVDADDVMGTLRQLGDISMGNGQKLESLARAFGKMSSAGKATMEDINIMIDAGFNPLAVISEKTGVSMTQLRDKVSDGNMSFKAITGAMSVATGEGGRFNNMLQRISGTTEGKLSNLADGIDQLRIAFGGGLNVGLKDVLDKANMFIPTMTEGATRLGEAAGRLLTLLAQYLPGTIDSLSNMISDAGGIFAALKNVIVNVLRDPAIKAAVAELGSMLLPKALKESLPGSAAGTVVKGSSPFTTTAAAGGLLMKTVGGLPGLGRFSRLASILTGIGVSGIGGKAVLSEDTSNLEKSLGGTLAAYGSLQMAKGLFGQKLFGMWGSSLATMTRVGSSFAKNPYVLAGILGGVGGGFLGARQEEKTFQSQKARTEQMIKDYMGDFVYSPNILKEIILPDIVEPMKKTITIGAEGYAKLIRDAKAAKTITPAGMSMIEGIRMFPSTIAKEMTFPLMGQGKKKELEPLKSDGIGGVGGMITSLARLGGGKAFAGTNNLVALQTAANGYLAQIVRNTQKSAGSTSNTMTPVWG